MKTTRWWLTVAGIVVGGLGLGVGAGGCSRPAPGMNGDGGVSPGDAGPGGPDGGTAPDGGTVWPVRPAALCAPQPMPLDTGIAPDLRAWVLEAEARGCRLGRLERDLDGDGVPDEVVEPPAPGGRQCQDDACTRYEETLPMVARAWTRAGPYGREHWRAVITGRRVVADGAERLELTLEGRTDGSSAVQRLERAYDGEGRLLEERHLWNGALWTELTNRYEAGRLVEAVRDDHVNGTGRLVASYRWDGAGRLMEATEADPAAPGATAQTATFVYDAAGRIAEVHRTLAGQPFLDQSWVWEGERLAERSVVLHDDGGAWPRVALDDHAPRGLVDPWFEVRWDDALFVTRGGCALPPRSMGHGYPAGEGLWELGWPLAERPAGIGFDYGYAGYAYYYGEQAWFGHGGVGVSYTGPGWGRSLSITLRYDAQERLLEEVVEATDGDWSQHLVREREHGPARADGGPGPLRGDLLTVETTAPDANGDVGTSRFGSAIAFDYADGRLAERRWTLEDFVAATQSWGYDAAGRLVTHAIGYDPILATGAGWDRIQPPPPDGIGSWTALEWRQTWSADGQEMVRQRWVDGAAQDGAETWSQRGVPGGRLVSRGSEFELTDAEGRVLAHGYGDYADPSYIYERSMDASGWLLGWAYRDRQANRTERETYTHECR